VTTQHNKNLNPRELTNFVVDKLNAKRQEIWLLYGFLAAEDLSETDESIEVLIKNFCQTLVDYISLGHFSVYQRVLEGNERRKKTIEVVERVYPSIAAATDKILSFSEQCQQCGTSTDRLKMLEQLSALGEHLAIRCELEDMLISEIAR
jgi:regulator of sigma D